MLHELLIWYSLGEFFETCNYYVVLRGRAPPCTDIFRSCTNFVTEARGGQLRKHQDRVYEPVYRYHRQCAVYAGF